MGVLTHLDLYKKTKKKQSIMYHVKHRFWKEIYSGAKLFVLKGVERLGTKEFYYKSDVQNLIRFISQLKFRPLLWRNSHPHLLVDRFEDNTPAAQVAANPKCDRIMSFYGYVRGCNFRDVDVHLCGIGDFTVKEMTEMEDPVPLPHNRKRHLTKSGRVYAPMAQMGPVLFDREGAYITIRSTKSGVPVQQSYEV